MHYWMKSSFNHSVVIYPACRSEQASTQTWKSLLCTHSYPMHWRQNKILPVYKMTALLSRLSMCGKMYNIQATYTLTNLSHCCDVRARFILACIATDLRPLAGRLKRYRTASPLLTPITCHKHWPPPPPHTFFFCECEQNPLLLATHTHTHTQKMGAILTCNVQGNSNWCIYNYFRPAWSTGTE